MSIPGTPRHECLGLFGINPEPRFFFPPRMADTAAANGSNGEGERERLAVIWGNYKFKGI